LKIVVSLNGPYLVTGGVPLSRQVIEAEPNGDSTAWREAETFQAGDAYALCRCGNSRNKPFCDRSHLGAGFHGTESDAARLPYLDQARAFEGPGRVLGDAKALCVGARFCHPHGTAWRLVERTGEQSAAGLLDQEVGNCPSGRLVAWNRRTGEAFEPSFEPSIGVVEDPLLGLSGPLWVRGGITVESGEDGHVYEKRNRVTLCRCGRSGNKPFCDGTHAATRFRDDWYAGAQP
jgi:CDGSH-type Zn-finger protein